ncbi:MAG: hypothetical protein LBM02_09640, partial [Lachnospiraceae bacterium]|nr:hypothetical protein [Lachnospiraceae bacterium]
MIDNNDKYSGDDNKEIFLKGIEKKYNKDFKIIRYQDSGYFWAEFEDKNGIKATGIYNVNGDTILNKVLNSSNYRDDTYYESYFNEKAKKILEPILKDEPIDHYYLSVDNPCGSTKTDLSIS